MESGSDSRTSVSLLGRLHRNPSDAGAWDEFVRQYGRKIYQWCRGWNLQDADAQDLTQNVMLEIARQMRTFTYDPARSFRGWLKTLAHGAWCDLLSRRRPWHQSSGDSGALAQLQSIPDADAFTRQIEEQYDAELLEAATIRVRLRIQPQTWDIFRLLVYEDSSVVEVAAKMHIQVSAVYMAKSRVQKMLKEEIAKLE